MTRELSQKKRHQKSRTVSPRTLLGWERFVQSVKRITLAVSLVVGAALMGLLTQRATDMPVQHIAITGEMRHVARETVEAVLTPRVADGFLLTDLSAIARELETLPWVFDVNVRREWPGTIHVQVTEQMPIARWGVMSYINQHGEVFDGETFERYDNLPLLWSEHSEPPVLIEHFKLFQMLLAPHGLSVAALSEDRLKQVSAQLTDGTDVQFGDKDFAKRVRRFVALLESERESTDHSIAKIDLRYESGAAVLRKKQKFAVAGVSQQQGGQ